MAKPNSEMNSKHGRTHNSGWLLSCSLSLDEIVYTARGHQF